MRYEYSCTECNYIHEYDLKIADRDSHEGDRCPTCDEGLMHRGVGNAGFVLKGRGWERDGYSSHVGDTPEFKKKFGKQTR